VKRRVQKYFILLISLLLLILVLRKVGFEELVDTLTDTDPYWLLVSFSLEPFLVLVSVIKWQILLKSQDSDVPLARLYGLYLVGRFFNNFLPSTVGGDVVRGYELGNYTKDYSGAVASIFVERLTGFITLVILAIFSLLLHSRLLDDIRLSSAIGLAVIGLVGVLWLTLDARPLALLDRRMTFPVARKLIPKLRKFHSSLNNYRKFRRALTLALFWSFVFMFLAIANVYTSALTFHRPISFLEIAAVVPLILVVSMLPFTVNGLGLQEWAYVLLFTLIGLPASVGLSTIILIRGKNLIVAALGGLVYPLIKLSKESAYQSNKGT
jgi:uncharacterized protein (TIRG00374 family)